MKVAALTAGGAALASGCSSPASGEKQPTFDPNDSYWALEQPPANSLLAEDMAVDVAVERIGASVGNLIHSDLLHINVLVEADRITGVVDWGWGMAGCHKMSPPATPFCV